MDKKIFVRVEEHRASGVTRTLNYSGAIEGSVWWQVDGDLLPPPLSTLDFAVSAMIFPAMREGADLHICGEVSEILLYRIKRFQEVWSKWRPLDYRAITVTADDTIKDRANLEMRAVIPFSGGADASFTLLRHTINRSSGEPNVVAAVMVLGFDIPLSEEGAYEIALSSAKELCEDAGVPLVCMRTNFRSVIRNWEMEFGAGLASVLQQFEGAACLGLIGSDEDYGSIVTPWGSHPVTYPLLSSNSFDLVYDGGGFTRSEKIAELASWPAANVSLRVCWEGPKTGKNCGICEKCIRTKLNYMASGHEPPIALAGRPSNWQIVVIKARNRVQNSYLRDILATARKNNINESWTIALRAAIWLAPVKYALKFILKPFRSMLRI